MRVGLVQMQASGNGWRDDGAIYDRNVAEAAAKGCSVVLFPELSDTGYALSAMQRLAGTWPGPALAAVQDAARRHGVGVIAGLSERDGDRIYNSAVAVDRAGSLCGRYRKTHLFLGPEGMERDVFTPGERLETVTLDGVCWGLSICFDLRFPEVFRRLALDGAQVLVNLAAWPRVRIADWSVLCRARAIENQVFLAGVNQCGATGTFDFGGSSCVIGPGGDILGEDGGTGAGLRVADLDMNAIPRLRGLLPVMPSRRPSLYGAW
jgi:predicted amidohydrolase